jgi:hypothetical protein
MFAGGVSEEDAVVVRMMMSATEAFVDHVIELPTDDDDDVGKRRTPANGKQRARATSVGSRATPQSVSKPSSVGQFSTAREVEVVVHNLDWSSKDGKGIKKNGKGMGDMGKRQTRPAEEAEEDEDAPQPAHPPNPKALLVQTSRLSDRGSSRETSTRADERATTTTSSKGNDYLFRFRFALGWRRGEGSLGGRQARDRDRRRLSSRE